MEKKLNTRACTHKRYCHRVYKISLYFIFFKLYLQMTKITKIISSMKSNEHNNNKKQISISSDRTLNKCIKNVFALWKIKYKITKRTRIKEEKKTRKVWCGGKGERGEGGDWKEGCCMRSKNIVDSLPPDYFAEFMISLRGLMRGGREKGEWREMGERGEGFFI